ncbi:ABC-F family ATP-binding cassette domain-containing protein [Cupriavidus pauculus]|uniref:ABC transporter ATP-binding protein n=1 Tax=Cupriavidus pauculus TaxID=82633 RepID=A0A2N5CG48_9BURK|nr:ABC-F family ATP-binding cassette domain-containing protein [Cupriavidus pauculus]PLQ01219.1 ABC transporter ATP-binding protein [Cupriavidus pauculus]
MTDPYLRLEGLSYVLPDGRTLFSDLDEIFDRRPTGLVGRNGAGKSVLAQILAGQLLPTRGRCLRFGSVCYLAQQVSPPGDATVAGLAGVQHTLDALARIEAGSSAPEDFDAVGAGWDVRQRLQQALERSGLGHLDPATTADTLSGGEAMRVALVGAMLSDADFLILDEPSNHLDRPARWALIEQLQQWPRGLLVLSHDRALLDTMPRIVELSSLGLRSYGGNYTFYAQCKTDEQQHAIGQLEQRKLERKREQRSMVDQRERQARRHARGNREGKTSNQAKILLGGQKARSEVSAGKLRQQQAASQTDLDQRVRNAAQQVEDAAHITLHGVPVAQVGQVAHRRVAELDAVALPFVSGATRSVSLIVTGKQRVGVVGPNGCGKSTLLKTLAGQLAPLAGACRRSAETIYLDQQLANVDPAQSVLAQMQAANGTATEANLRMLLAHLGLDAQKIAAPSGALSGGEQLKAALACTLYADPPPQLLLLDEPSNHLDLPSAQALEAMLRGYKGALIVVSHDDAFLDGLALTDRLLATDEGWQLDAW